MTLAHLVGTVLGVGHLRPAPGTWGSFVALPWAWMIHVLGGMPLLVFCSLALFAAGWWATAEMTKGNGDHDPSEIVVDEVVGQWVALLPLSFAAWSMEISVLAMWPGWIAAFVLFRVFDITKVGPIGWADRMHTPLGVMLDDLLAGIFAAFGVLGLAALYHGIA